MTSVRHPNLLHAAGLHNLEIIQKKSNPSMTSMRHPNVGNAAGLRSLEIIQKKVTPL